MVLRSWSLPVALVLVSSTALLGQGASAPTGEEARFEALVRAYQADAQRGGGRGAGRAALAVDPGPTGTPSRAQAHADRAARFAKDLAGIHTEELTHDQWILYGLTRYN